MFSFGGSKSSSSSQSTSKAESSSSSVSGGISQSQSSQSIAFEDIFAQLFGGAQGAAAGLNPSLLTEAANGLFSQGTGFLGQIGGDAGSAYMAERLGSEDPNLQNQIDLLGEDLGNFFNEQLMPGITSEAVAGGTLGGGRQGVAQGAAMREVGNQFARGAAQLRAQDQASRDQMAQALGAQSLQGITAGLSALPALAGLSEMSFSAGMKPFEALAAILGGPTVLGESSSSSMDFASSLASSFEESQATSKSKSMSLSMGFSDRRLKRNVVRIGTLFGFPWYSWTYVWGERACGVMADEIPRRFVHRHASGFDMVDYAALMRG